MANQTGIAITIRAWLPTGKTLDEQFAALSIVKTAHESGDYAPLLSAATIEAVQTEQKTRRRDEPQPDLLDPPTDPGTGAPPPPEGEAGDPPPPEPEAQAEKPKGRKAA